MIKEEKSVIAYINESMISNTGSDNPNRISNLTKNSLNVEVYTHEKTDDNENTKLGLLIKEEEDNYYIFRRVEITKLTNRAFNRSAYFLSIFILCSYLYVSLTSNAVLIGNSAYDIINKAFYTHAHPLEKHYYNIIQYIFY